MKSRRLFTPRARLIAYATLLIAAFVAGALWRRGETANPHQHAAMATDDTFEPETWTCSMHPQIKLPKPGQCPICFMDLIPLDTEDDDETGLRELSVSENAARRMDIETVAVERRSVTTDVRMLGKIDYDETRVSNIAAWVPGRLDRLFVDYTGMAVNKGDRMVSIYSPDLLSAQEELLQAVKVANARKSATPGNGVGTTSHPTLDAAREKLRRWGLAPEQIEQIERRGEADDHVTLHAPAGGIVVHKNAREGMYVRTGMRIYTIADLSRVWVHLDAYESDLAWLREGQKVTFITEAYPGEPFSGMIAFIPPVLDEATRTVKVRVEAPNADGRLKPGMFVRAVAKAEVDGKPLVIPASAPLLTGKRAIVYVEIPDREKPTYEGREIVLGPRAGDAYVVREGLKEDERVVTKGSFKLDAELQIRAKPSMMTPQGGGAPSGHAGHGGEEGVQAPADGTQTHCPVMGGVINREVYVDYQGQRIYFCCPGCEQTFLKAPEKFLQQMADNGVRPERIEMHHEH